jgi:hypothetical protein
LLVGWCVKAPAAKVGRSNRLGRASSSRAASVPGVYVEFETHTHARDLG